MNNNPYIDNDYYDDSDFARGNTQEFPPVDYTEQRDYHEWREEPHPYVQNNPHAVAPEYINQQVDPRLNPPRMYTPEEVARIQQESYTAGFHEGGSGEQYVYKEPRSASNSFARAGAGFFGTMMILFTIATCGIIAM